MVRLTNKSPQILKRWMDRHESAQSLYGRAYDEVVINRLLNPVSVQLAKKRCFQEIGCDVCHYYRGHTLRVVGAQELLRMGGP